MENREMADTPVSSASPPAGELDQRLVRLEEMLKRSEDLRRKTARTARFGILIVLALFFIFIFRIVSHFNTTYVHPLRDDPGLFMRKLGKKLEMDKLIEKELQVAGSELMKRGTDFAGRVGNKLMARSGEVQDKLAVIGEGLQAHAEKEFEAKLGEALEKSLKDSFESLGADLEELKGDALDKNLSAATAHFNETLTDILEDRVALVASSLGGLKDAANRVGQSAGSEKLKDANPGAVEEMLLNTLLELAAYEISPELGKAPVTPAAEGAKP
jgi:hypothetical protein